ncbi:quinolinate synthase NadA [archaeon]|jgi:quinolinate synthase|nr:quinolinate synthase NadA [archaeon]
MDKKLIKKINKLKKEKGAIILAHNYQRPEIYEVADFIGDSFELSKKARDATEKIIVFCGVKFMAETAKILSPDKTILLPEITAGCPMADMIGVEELVNFKKEHPNAKVVSYVNTNADTKTETDVCCTSSNAVEIVEGIDADEILFVPDKNLGSYVQKKTSKKIISWNGFCVVHERIRKEAILEMRKKYSEAIIIAHPECRSEVVDACDYAMSTGGMVKFARENNGKTIILATERDMINRLKRDNPNNKYLTVGGPCVNMKRTTLNSVLRALEDEIYEIELSDDVLTRAKDAIVRMVGG